MTTTPELVEGPAEAPVVDALLYAQLRRHAEARLRQEGREHTAPTSLVHETLLRLWDAADSRLEREDLLARAATVMRRLLVDRARRRQRFESAKEHVAASADDVAPRTLLALDESLDRLQEHDPELARVVELRFLLEMEVEDAARMLGLSTATVKRRWRAARSWLAHDIRRRLAP